MHQLGFSADVRFDFHQIGRDKTLTLLLSGQRIPTALSF